MRPFLDIQEQYRQRKTEINAAIQSVLDDGQFIMGPQVKMLENELVNYVGAKHCITCANGTDALQLALMAIDIKAGDEVITTPFTFVATAETIALLGAKPVFVDIEEDSFLIDHRLIAEKITAKTKAIIPVSLYGQIPEMNEINAIAKNYSEKFGHKIYVIEDAAQSFGAEYKGKKSGNVCDIATTSFFPTKPLGCYGDGGAIFTSDDNIAQALREIRVHGQSKRYYHTRVGVNSRLDTLQAAILLVKLKYFEDDLKARQRNAKDYDEYYKNTNVITPVTLPNREHAFGQYTVKVNNRDEFHPLHKQPAFLDETAHCPIAERVSGQVVSLAMQLLLSEPEVELATI
ncbi:MAG: DegT/DnrJ/EryC1/StrS family aminotransferase [Gammaproteobacteria bacterium]|nr:DegT/DnrJ/EryC1/StrS family aminotransferase [Gammaproteobacteria bacterium]